MPSEGVSVCKVGGSLLTLPDLAERLRTSFRLCPAKHCLIVPGGGATADLVREWDRVHQIGDEAAHWLAIHALSFNAHFFAQVLPETVIVEDRRGAQMAWQENRLPILDVCRFLHEEESLASHPLPHNWSVTSDSIAAWTAVVWPAHDLILVKSATLPSKCGLEHAANLGLTDSYFTHIASRVPRVNWVNMRSEQPRLRNWIVAGRLRQ